ncbi:MAG: four helix bundle protein [Planctomycetota bacterium]|jgi:four helix bundle protein
MLRIYPVILDWIATLPPMVRAIGASDPNLADQLRRSSTSVGLNVVEGMGAVGKAKTHCYRIALREMREAVAAIHIAGRLGYIAALGVDDAERQEHIIATLVKLARPSA